MYRKMGIAVMTLAGLAASAQANTTRFFSGSSCLAHLPADNDFLARLTEGCFDNRLISQPDANGCAPDMVVALPISGNTSDTVDLESITVNYTNSNVTERISCQALVMNAAGTVFSTPSQVSPLAPSYATPATGSLTWSGSTLPSSGNAITGVRTQTIFCTVPSLFSVDFQFGCRGASSFSGIINYAVETVQP